MLDYTKAAFYKTVEDFKRVGFFYGIVMQALYIGYLVYALCVGAGVLWANVALLAACSLYLIFYLVTEGKKHFKQARKITKRSFKSLKLIINAFSLGVAIYGIYAATTHLTPMSVILTGLMAITWILHLVLELALVFTENRIELIVTGMQADFEPVTSTVHNAGNFIKKITGQEIEKQEEAPPSRARRILDKRVLRQRAERKKNQNGIFGFFKKSKTANDSESGESEAREFAQK